MGGRGTFAAGKNVAYQYETVGNIEGVKVLRKMTGRNKNPEESHSSEAYIILDRYGDVKQFRKFRNDHTPEFDIDYQHEPNIGKVGKSYHIHYYGSQYKNGRSGAIPISEKELSKYKKYFNKDNIKKGDR